MRTETHRGVVRTQFSNPEELCGQLHAVQGTALFYAGPQTSELTPSHDLEVKVVFRHS